MELQLFTGFTRQFVKTGEGYIFVRTIIDAEKPPLLLLHGFPQTHAEFQMMIPFLLLHFIIVLMDLRGYGLLTVVTRTSGSGYSKRLMAQDCVSMMAELGYKKFAVVGHDRGARVTYRLAFDLPETIVKAVVLDIIPTAAMYAGFGNLHIAH